MQIPLAAEIYVNEGEVVFSVRFYGKGTKHRLKIEAEGFRRNLEAGKNEHYKMFIMD